MKKNKVKTVLIVVIILIVCLNIGVYAAYVLSATEVNYTKSDGTTVDVKSALDELYIKVPTHEIGDEVTVGGEKFYVLEWDNNSNVVRLISKYNLNKDGTAQVDAEYGTTACTFSSTNYWSSSYKGSRINLNDFIGFTSTDALGKAKSYGISKEAVSSRLLSYKEADSLKTRASSDTKIYNMLWGKANTANGYLKYWLADGGSPITVDYVDGNSWIYVKFLDTFFYEFL